MFKIEKNIPIPAPKGKGYTYKDTLSKMIIGDSIFLPLPNDCKCIITFLKKQQARAYNYTHSNCLATKFTVRESGYGVRLWRVK